MQSNVEYTRAATRSPVVGLDLWSMPCFGSETACTRGAALQVHWIDTAERRGSRAGANQLPPAACLDAARLASGFGLGRNHERGGTVRQPFDKLRASSLSRRHGGRCSPRGVACVSV